MKLLRNINKFYKHYDLEHPFDTITMTKNDMYDHDALMTAYESMWLTIEQYDGTEKEYQWLLNLYGELGYYITYGDKGKVKVDTIGKLIAFIFSIFSTGILTATAVVYGIDLKVGVVMALSIIIAIGSGIGAYENIKGE